MKYRIFSGGNNIEIEADSASINSAGILTFFVKGDEVAAFLNWSYYYLVTHGELY